MRVRSLKDQEGELFWELVRSNIYPFLSFKKFQQWEEGEGLYQPLSYVLEDNNGELIGGAKFEIQDHLSRKKVLLQLDAMFIVKKHWRQGLGTRLFREAIEIVCSDYEERGFHPTSLVIQTTNEDKGAVAFYRSVLGPKGLGYSFSETTKMVKEIMITVFIVEFPE